MTGCSFGDVVPVTYNESLIATIMMVFGATFYGKVFGDFEALMQLTRGDIVFKK